MPDLPTLVFLLVVAFVVTAWVRAVSGGGSAYGAPPLLRWVAIAGGWLVLTALPVLSGLMRPDGPIPAQLFMAAVLAAALGFSLSSAGDRIAGTTPLWALVAFQGFRLPLEWVLHRWGELGVAPPQLTWSGQNPDVVTGILALAMAPVVARSPRTAWVPTLVGLALLANIGRIVVTSLPGPLQRFPDPLTLPFRFPHVWIASVCVAGALAGHVLAIRALRARRHLAE